MHSLVGTQQVARGLDVSEATVKRWCDRGLDQCARTAGGHRRVPIGSVLAFIRETGRELVASVSLGLPESVGRIAHGPIVAARIWMACHFSVGREISFASMASAVESTRPQLFWLSDSTIEDVDEFIKSYETFYEFAQHFSARCHWRAGVGRDRAAADAVYRIWRQPAAHPGIRNHAQEDS